MVRVALTSGLGLRLSLGLMMAAVSVVSVTFSCLSWHVYVTVNVDLKLTPSIGILRKFGCVWYLSGVNSEMCLFTLSCNEAAECRCEVHRGRYWSSRQIQKRLDGLIQSSCVSDGCNHAGLAGSGCMLGRTMNGSGG